MTDRRLRLALLGVTAAGVAVAGYLTWAHYAGVGLLCAGGGGGCGRVQGSSYATLAGVPVAVIGLGGYLAILCSLLLRGEPARLATAALALVGARSARISPTSSCLSSRRSANGAWRARS